MHKYTAKEILKANNSYRYIGAISKKAIVPKYVEKNIDKRLSILDYGAGTKAIHTIYLRKKGFNVTAYDFGSNIVEGVHDTLALKKQYDVVFASNVINVQGTEDMIVRTFKQLKKVVKPNGLVIFNYPASPRYTDTTVLMLLVMINKVFKNPFIKVAGSSAAPLFEITTT